MSKTTSTYTVKTATERVEQFVRELIRVDPGSSKLTDEQLEELEVDVYTYGRASDEPGRTKRHMASGVRVAEVSVWQSTGPGTGGGSSYMQTDLPHGIAVCAQAERCIVALVENWDESIGGEINAEFWRLAFAWSGSDQKVMNVIEKNIDNDAFPGSWYEEGSP